MTLHAAKMEMWIQTYSRVVCALSMSPLLSNKAIKTEAKRVANLAVEGLEENFATLHAPATDAQVPDKA